MNGLIEIEGRKLEIDHQISDPTRPTLVFLHEGLGCVAMWRNFPREVAAVTRCNLLVYGRLGYGQSDPAELPRSVRYMHDEALITLPAILAKLNIGKHILVGHSDGGSIALIYGGGVRSPHLMGIITLAAHVFNEAICVQSIEAAKVAYHTTHLREKLAKYHADPDNAFWGWNDVWLHPDFWHWNIEEYLPTVTVPILAIQGLDDEYGTSLQVETIVNSVASDHVEKCLLPDCNHSPHRSQPTMTLTVITTFIQRIIEQ